MTAYLNALGIICSLGRGAEEVAGKLFAGDADSYQYLAESIRKHPPQAELQAMMEAAGLARCSYRNLSAGIVAIHTGYKV